MTFPSFPTGSTIRADATLDDLLNWYHWAVADGADSEAYLLAAMRQFPQWASDLFEHAVIARAVENLPDAPEPSAEERGWAGGGHASCPGAGALEPQAERRLRIVQQRCG
jgi:hypothetical protein